MAPRWFGAAGLWLLLTLSAAAHPDHGEGIHAALVGASRTADGRPEVTISLMNNTGGAVTLRGLLRRHGDVLQITRRRSMLGLELAQPVSFVRLSPGERLLLGPPEYSVTGQGLEIGALLSGDDWIVADFGPDGQVVLELEGAPQTTE